MAMYEVYGVLNIRNTLVNHTGNSYILLYLGKKISTIIIQPVRNENSQISRSPRMPDL